MTKYLFIRENEYRISFINFSIFKNYYSFKSNKFLAPILQDIHLWLKIIKLAFASKMHV